MYTFFACNLFDVDLFVLCRYREEILIRRRSEIIGGIILLIYERRRCFEVINYLKHYSVPLTHQSCM